MIIPGSDPLYDQLNPIHLVIHPLICFDQGGARISSSQWLSTSMCGSLKPSKEAELADLPLLALSISAVYPQIWICQ